MSGDVERIPNKDLYRFVASKGFKDEATEIRHMKFSWPCSYDTTPRNGYLILLLKEKNLWEEFLNEYWPSGRSIGGEKDIQRCIRKAKEYDAFLADTQGVEHASKPGRSHKVSKLSQHSLNQILYGPPGTGKTYETTRLAVEIVEPDWFAKQCAAGNSAPPRETLKQRYDQLVAEKRIVFTTFHQSFAYEDFVEGIRAESDMEGNLSYPIKDGVFKKLCATANPGETQRRPCVLIIDEINRGNMSRIFGELITLLEPGKRKGTEDAREVTLPYSKKPFSVPDNVYVIGTMNTADKSLAQLDLALRRRFNFVEMPPKPDLLTGVRVYGVDVGAILTVMNQRIEVLLDREHQIGHSYFLPLASMSDSMEREQELGLIFEKQIIPLLQEYFFDDWQRISWVLNDNVKAADDRFVCAGGMQSLDGLFAESVIEQISDRRYFVNGTAFSRAGAYTGILPSNRNTEPAVAVPEVESVEA